MLVPRQRYDQPVLRTLRSEQAAFFLVLDKLEDLLIENRALDSALEGVKRFVLPAAHERLRTHVEEMKADPGLRDLVRRRFADYRDLESAFWQLLAEDFVGAFEMTRQSKIRNVEGVGVAFEITPE